MVCACLSSLESKEEGGKESLANHRRLYTCIFSERVTLNKIMQSEQPSFQKLNRCNIHRFGLIKTKTHTISSGFTSCSPEVGRFFIFFWSQLPKPPIFMENHEIVLRKHPVFPRKITKPTGYTISHDPALELVASTARSFSLDSNYVHNHMFHTGTYCIVWYMLNISSEKTCNWYIVYLLVNYECIFYYTIHITEWNLGEIIT